MLFRDNYVYILFNALHFTIASSVCLFVNRLMVVRQLFMRGSFGGRQVIVSLLIAW